MTKPVSSIANSFRQKGFQAAFVLVFNSFSWYFPLFVLFADSIDKLQLSYIPLITVFGFHYLAIAGSAFLGNKLAEKIGHNRLLLLWIGSGVLSSALLFLINFSSLVAISISSISLGISLGLGFPSCLSYFGDNSPSDRRGLVGGVAFAFTFMAIAVAGFLSTLSSFEISILGFAVWRLAGLFSFFILKTEQSGVQKKVPYLTIVRERPFLLYFVPWIMFCVVNFFQAPFFDTELQRQYLMINPETNLRYMISLGEFGIGGVSMLVAGFLSDRFGRKRLIIAAYAMVGIGYALLSFASENQFVFYAYVLLDGIAWGIFFLMFLLIVWGDLAQSRMKNRYYLIGNMPFILSSYVSVLVMPYIGSIQAFAAFSFASFFLFAAVIPLMVAPETLPEKVMRDQDLRSYAEKALKQVKKEEEKKQNHANEPEQTSESEESREDEEAHKLAEQYY
jgi:MFS family permease